MAQRMLGKCFLKFIIAVSTDNDMQIARILAVTVADDLRCNSRRLKRQQCVHYVTAEGVIGIC